MKKEEILQGVASEWIGARTKMPSKTRPTIAELEAILNSESQEQVDINPDGEVVLHSARINELMEFGSGVWNAALDAAAEECDMCRCKNHMHHSTIKARILALKGGSQ